MRSIFMEAWGRYLDTIPMGNSEPDKNTRLLKRMMMQKRNQLSFAVENCVNCLIMERGIGNVPGQVILPSLTTHEISLVTAAAIDD